MIVASLDPVGKTVSMLSLPRDMVGVPLGNGDVYGPKLNSLMSFAERNPKSFPKGGMRTLEDAVGALLGIPIHYYARIDFIGFIAMVDAVGGVDIDVKRTLRAKHYDGYGLTTKGFRLTKGVHHLTGAEALAYARIRKGVGETDFTRAARQQEVIVALRSSVTSGGSLFWRLPDLLDAVADTIRTNVPTTRLPELAAIIDEVGAKDVVQVVIGHPLVASANTKYGSSQVPKIDKIQAVAARLFSTPGTPPVPWPTPKATKAPKASPTPLDRPSLLGARPASRTGRGGPRGPDRAAAARGSRARRSPRRRRGRARRATRPSSPSGPSRPIGLSCRPSCAQDETSASSSSVPSPPGRAMNPSDRAAISALRSWSVSTTRSSVRPP